MEALENKVSIITGAGSGIGRSTAVLFSKYGAQVVLADINFSRVESVATECEAVGLSKNQILPLKCDITSADDRKLLIEECMRKFGKLDVLVNNAGILGNKSVIDTTSEMYDTVMEVNLKAHVFLTQLAVSHLKLTKGSIVNVSSVLSEEAVPSSGLYSLSKAGMDCFTKVLALELAEFGVRVNSVRPATILTGICDTQLGKQEGEAFLQKLAPFHPLGRIGLPEEVAMAIGFLASDMSSYSTGNFLYVDGGRHCVGARYNPNVK